MKLRLFLARRFRRLAFLLAAAAAGGAVVAQAGRWSVKLDIFSHFAPLYAAMGGVALVLWLATGRTGRAPLLLAVTALASAGPLMAPELTAAVRPERAAPRDEMIRIVQFNLLYSNRAPQASADWVLAQDADIVVVEESFSESADILRRLEGAYPYITPCASGRCSARVLSKRRPVDNRAIRRVPGLGSMASARFEGAKGPFTVVGVHYTWPDPLGWQWGNRQGLRESLAEQPKENLIVAGDFNSTPWSFALRRQDRDLGLERRTRALFSWSPRPWLPRILPIDHVYAGSNWKTVSVRRGPRLGSDHFPVVVDLTR